MSLMETIYKRSYGKKGKELTALFQALSAIVFIILAFLMKDQVHFLLLFMFEGVGQIFFAWENKRAVEEGNFQVKYFEPSTLITFSVVSFALAIVVRFHLAISILPEKALLFNILTAVSILLWLILHFFGDEKKDLYGGIFIVLSSFVLGATFIYVGTSPTIGYNLVTYGFLIMFSTLFLKPWVAELLNIFLWIHLFTLVQAL
ncbi:MAG: hypothetical protein CME70_11700 [Halobacteriovorax sp.]|nr:hypothetical protein [Halobacteriovorax sp.]|tara:strand:+ start:19454 stop:20062 length:609 start_codon:yes stop_codon:yes gene_type:complete